MNQFFNGANQIGATDYKIRREIVLEALRDNDDARLRREAVDIKKRELDRDRILTRQYRAVERNAEAWNRLSATSLLGFDSLVKANYANTNRIIAAIDKKLGSGSAGGGGGSGLSKALLGAVGGWGAWKTIKNLRNPAKIIPRVGSLLGGGISKILPRALGATALLGTAVFQGMESYEKKDSQSAWQAYLEGALEGGATGLLAGGVTGIGAIPGAVVGAVAGTATTFLGRNWDEITGVVDRVIEDLDSSKKKSDEYALSFAKSVTLQSSLLTELLEKLGLVEKKLEDTLQRVNRSSKGDLNAFRSGGYSPGSDIISSDGSAVGPSSSAPITPSLPTSTLGIAPSSTPFFARGDLPTEETTRPVDNSASAYSQKPKATFGLGIGPDGIVQGGLSPDAPLRDVVKAELLKYAKSKGATDAGYAALLGNVEKESGLNPFRTGDNGTAFGLYQMRHDRAARWVKRFKNDPEAQKLGIDDPLQFIRDVEKGRIKPTQEQTRVFARTMTEEFHESKDAKGNLDRDARLAQAGLRAEDVVKAMDYYVQSERPRDYQRGIHGLERNRYELGKRYFDQNAFSSDSMKYGGVAVDIGPYGFASQKTTEPYGFQNQSRFPLPFEPIGSSRIEIEPPAVRQNPTIKPAPSEPSSDSKPRSSPRNRIQDVFDTMEGKSPDQISLNDVPGVVGDPSLRWLVSVDTV